MPELEDLKIPPQSFMYLFPSLLSSRPFFPVVFRNGVMFTTFAAQITSPSPPPPPAEAEGGASGAPGAPHPALQTLSQTQTPTPKRRKVARACDACRLNRIKCNDEQPCRNCRERGAKCTNSMPWEAHSLHAARRYVLLVHEPCAASS